MGTYAPIPWAGQGYLDWTIKKVVKPILKGLEQKNSRYYGCLYPGLKITKEGPKVLEFNARFGDPETQSYMRLLDSDFVEIVEACLSGELGKISVKWKPKFAVCVIMASKGYPETKSKEVLIKGIEEAEKISNVVIFHSGTKIKNNLIYACGGRVLGVTATGKTLQTAIRTAYRAVSKIKFEGMQYRTDIGKKALKQTKKLLNKKSPHFMHGVWGRGDSTLL